MAQVTETILLVAHGAPSDPAPLEAVLQDLARAVGRDLPEYEVRGTTLAMPDGLASALDGPGRPVIMPVFMAGGWFVNSFLPKRLHEHGHGGARVLTPLGLLPELHTLCVSAALDGCRRHGVGPSATALVLAAHGSARSVKSAEAARIATAHIASAGRFRKVVPAYVEETPFLGEVFAALSGPALCLPFFATAADHVRVDLPDAVAECRRSIPILPHIGSHPKIPALLAGHIRRSLTVAAPV